MTAYRALVSRLMASRPRDGWLDAQDIPPLTDEDLATVIEDDASVLVEALDSVYSPGTVARILRASSAPEDIRNGALGLYLRQQIDALARASLLVDLQAEESRDADDRDAFLTSQPGCVLDVGGAA